MDKTPIQKFYSNSVIFITGGTGFLGTILVEKLLRTCPDIKKMYILIRDKKNKTSDQRINEYFAGPLWNKMKIWNPNYKHCVSFIKGDLLGYNFNIAEEDYNTLINDITIIFHVAATVRFDEPLKNAVSLNICATKCILELAKQCQNLKAFVHCSTAYSQCIYPELEERFYKPVRDSEEFIKYCEDKSLEELNKLTPSILGKYPNTYTFTKSLAENILKKYEGQLPIALFRPSIVLGCYDEPIPGWVSNYFGPVGPMIGIGLGVIRVFATDPNFITDQVPVDYCANTMITAAYDVSKRDYRNQEIPVFNFVSGKQNPITWKEFFFWCFTYVRVYPSINAIWSQMIIFTYNEKFFNFCTFMLHTLPTFIIDSILKLSGRKPKLESIYKKVNVMYNLLNYFTSRQWKFHDDNTKKLYDSMAEIDKTIYPFDIKLVKWDIFIYHVVRYIRTGLIKEPVTNIFKAKKRESILKISHYFLIFILLALTYFFISTIFRIIF